MKLKISKFKAKILKNFTSKQIYTILNLPTIA